MSDLDMALDLWRRTRLDECARVVAVLTPDAETRGPLPSGRPAARHEAWLAVARLDDPADVGWLIASVVGSRVEPSADRLERLVERGPHPLVGDAARQWIVAGHFRTHHGHRWWGLVRKVAAWSSSDVDFAEIAVRLRHWPSQDMLRLAREVATWGRVAVHPTRPSVEDQRQLDALSARVPQPLRPRRSDRTGHDLLEAVFDDPQADGPRAVLADFLIGRGEPRGTFLQLQLARADRGGPEVHARHRLPREEWELLFDHEARWFGAPFPAMVTGAPERGFFAQVRISSHADQLRTLIAAPGLRTVRHLGVVRRTIRVRKALHELLTCPALRHLERVGNLWPEDVAVLATAAAHPRWIEMAPRGARLDQLGQAVAQLPTVERLDLPAHPDRIEVLGAIAVPTLGLSAAEWLALDAGYTTTPIARDRWPERLRQLLDGVHDDVRRIVITTESEGVAVVRTTRGWAVDLGPLVDIWPTPRDPRFVSVAILEALDLPVAHAPDGFVYRIEIGEPRTWFPPRLPSGPLFVDGGYRQAPHHWLSDLPELPEVRFSDNAHRWIQYADRTPRFDRVRLVRASGTPGPLLWRGDGEHLRYAWGPDDTKLTEYARLETVLGHPLEIVASPP